MDDKIIIDRMDAEEFLSMLMDAAKQDNPTRYYSAAQIIENIARRSGKIQAFRATHPNILGRKQRLGIHQYRE